MARVQRIWRGSSENGAGSTKMARVTSSEARALNYITYIIYVYSSLGASKKFRGAGNKFRDQLPGTYIQDGGYFD
jgi:hypothetical protein